MCLYPKLIGNAKYKPNGKNGGIVPPVSDIRVLYVPIKCGECIECRKQKANAWRIRLLEEIKTNNKSIFVTLTFSDEKITKLYEELKPIKGYELDNAAATIAVRRFLEIWRKHTGKSIRHFLVTELGHNGTENIHLHGLIFSKDINAIRQRWKYGWVYPRTHDEYKINYVNEKTINYIIKYITKVDKDHLTYKSRILTSKGMGKKYTETKQSKTNEINEKIEKTNETYRTRTGTKLPLPIYYRNKIYNEEQREKLWINKLDQETRWVLGQKISTKNGLKEYEKALKAAQEKNKRLGYGNTHKTWKQKEYEKQNREIMQLARMKKQKK